MRASSGMLLQGQTAPSAAHQQAGKVLGSPKRRIKVAQSKSELHRLTSSLTDRKNPGIHFILYWSLKQSVN